MFEDKERWNDAGKMIRIKWKDGQRQEKNEMAKEKWFEWIGRMFEDKRMFLLDACVDIY